MNSFNFYFGIIDFFIRIIDKEPTHIYKKNCILYSVINVANYPRFASVLFQSRKITIDLKKSGNHAFMNQFNQFYDFLFIIFQKFIKSLFPHQLFSVYYLWYHEISSKWKFFLFVILIKNQPL